MKGQRTIEDVETDLKRKIKAVHVSPKFSAILGAMFQEEWTSPAIVELIADSSGGLLGRMSGDIGFNHYLGAMSDLERNCRGIAEVAELTIAERGFFMAKLPRTL